MAVPGKYFDELSKLHEYITRWSGYGCYPPLENSLIDLMVFVFPTGRKEL